MSHNLAVLVRDQTGEQRFARVKVPGSLPRLVEVPAADVAPGASCDNEHWFTWLEQVIAADLRRCSRASR